MIRAPLAHVTALLALTSLGACSMAPDYRRPDAALPAQWPSGPAYPASTGTAQAHYSWRQCMADPRLARLIETALAGNQDIAGALANVAAARAAYRIQRASLLPEFDVGGSYSRAGGSGSARAGGQVVNQNSETFAVNGSMAAWEIDLFGRIRSLTDAQRARYLASTAAVRGTRMLVVAEVAQAWITRGRDMTLLAIARETAENAGRQVALTRRRVDGGIAPLDDQRKAEITLASAEADVAAQTTAVAQDENALRLVVGAEVPVADLPVSMDDASGSLCRLDAGLDSSILLARPDVVQAEYLLQAANANIGAARAALFPRISLTAVAGYASTALATLFNGGAFAWSSQATASYPIFSAGRGKAGVALADAQRDLALAQYRQAIQSAFRDVADTLARRGTIDAQLSASRAGAAAAADNARLTDRRYAGGIASALESLVAQQTLYAARRNAALVQAERAANLVELYRALGGDDPAAPAAP